MGLNDEEPGVNAGFLVVQAHARVLSNQKSKKDSPIHLSWNKIKTFRLAAQR
ncbi:hypothetical protein AAIH32_02995 [Pseudarthrobacter oxydans]|uniref:hypothetical protein n=1 Tax=Pseudarthrobacter oxydans TaxID=1671 RepID=UPI003D2E9CD6